MKKCILADNQFISSEGVSSLAHKMGIDLIIKVSTVDELKNELKNHPNALVVLDYTLFNFTSMEQMLHVKSGADKSTWLLFSEELSKQFVRYVLITDPTVSIVMKQDSEKEIREALHYVADQKLYICDSAKQILAEKPVSIEETVSLTASEKMVLREIALGKTTKEIAYEKSLSFHTVNSHRKNIYRKLEVNSLHEAIRYAIQAGLFDVSDYYI